MSRVLLAASYPSGARGESVRPYSLSDMDLATAAIVEGVLERGYRLRFGGHPTITGLVLDLAHRLKAGRQVELYQSRFFSAEYTPEMQRLVHQEGAMLVETPAATGSDQTRNRSDSLTVLRTAMLADPIDCAFFVGGMSGLREEVQLLRAASPNTAIFLLRRPGGMARILADEADEAVRANAEVLRGSAYHLLVADVLHQLA